MREIKFLLFMSLLWAVVIVTGACSSKHNMVPGAPDWVNQGSGAFSDAGEKFFYGVGAVSGIESPSLAMQTVDQRARADLARQLESYVNSLYRDYQASTSASSGTKVIEEQHIDGSLNTVSKVSVRGAQIVERWRDLDANTLYALARMDLAGFKASMESEATMKTDLKDYIRANGAKIFKEMEEKRGEKHD